MNRILVGMVLTTLLAFPVFAQNPELQIILSSGEKYTDVSVDSLDGNGLIITAAGTTLRIPVDSVAQVRTRGSSSLLREISIGLLAGGATGFIAGHIIDGINYKPGEPILRFSGNGPPEVVGSTPASGETNYKIILPIVGAGAGGIIGAIVGSSRADTSVDLTGLTVEEKNRILVPLIHKSELK